MLSPSRPKLQSVFRQPARFEIVFSTLQLFRGFYDLMTDLSHEHCPGGNLHVVPKLEILEKCQCLSHTDVPINLKAHICNWPPRIQVSHDVLSDYVQSRCLKFVSFDERSV